MSAIAGTAARKSTPVILNVYEPTKGQSPLIGVYHSGIEFSGTEYCFAGGADAGSGTGVMSQTPREMPAGGQWKFKQSVELGATTLTYNELNAALRELQDAFPANGYDVVHRNCNHFTTACAKRLGVDKAYPAWVNRAASWGSMFTEKPKNVKEAEALAQAAAPKESVFKTSVGHRLDGGTVQAKSAPAAAAASSSSSSAAKSSPVKPAAAASSAAGGAGGGKRVNPWADPNFIPPGMRKDPVVNGVMKPLGAAGAAPAAALVAAKK